MSCRFSFLSEPSLGQDTLGQIGPLLSAEKSDTNSPSYQEWKDKFSRIFSQEQGIILNVMFALNLY